MLKRVAQLGILSRSFCIGLLVGLLPLGCGSIPFPYHFYNIQPDSYAGKLLGPTPADDLPLSVCAPTEQSKGNCVILLSDAFYQLQLDYLETKQELIQCQKNTKVSGIQSP